MSTLTSYWRRRQLWPSGFPSTESIRQSEKRRNRQDKDRTIRLDEAGHELEGYANTREDSYGDGQLPGGTQRALAA